MQQHTTTVTIPSTFSGTFLGRNQESTSPNHGTTRLDPIMGDTPRKVLEVIWGRCQLDHKCCTAGNATIFGLAGVGRTQGIAALTKLAALGMIEVRRNGWDQRSITVLEERYWDPSVWHNVSRAPLSADLDPTLGRPQPDLDPTLGRPAPDRIRVQTMGLPNVETQIPKNNNTHTTASDQTQEVPVVVVAEAKPGEEESISVQQTVSPQDAVPIPTETAASPPEPQQVSAPQVDDPPGAAAPIQAETQESAEEVRAALDAGLAATEAAEPVQEADEAPADLDAQEARRAQIKAQEALIGEITDLPFYDKDPDWVRLRVKEDMDRCLRALEVVREQQSKGKAGNLGAMFRTAWTEGWQSAQAQKQAAAAADREAQDRQNDRNWKYVLASWAKEEAQRSASRDPAPPATCSSGLSPAARIRARLPGNRSTGGFRQ